MDSTIQNQWRRLHLLGHDAILYADGTVTLADVCLLTDVDGRTQYNWRPVADTHIRSIETYDDNPWVNIDIHHGAVMYGNQHIVFGDGAMEDDGFVASTTRQGNLNWAIFFTFSSPIRRVELVEDFLCCDSDIGMKIKINLKTLHDIKIMIDQTDGDRTFQS